MLNDQDITWQDAIAEGIKDPRVAMKRVDEETGLVAKFAAFWDSINAKKPGHAWADNPWVFAISFRRMEAS